MLARGATHQSKINAGPPGKSSTRERQAIRELLRQLGRPNRLRNDPIASRYVAPTDFENDYNGVDISGEEFIRSIILQLPSRCRIVLERTEIDGQSIAEVSKALAISERQVYRDKAKALSHISASLSSTSARAAKPSADAHYESADIELSHSDMLEQVGQLETACEVLRGHASSAEDPREQTSAYCALSRLALDKGSLGEARLYANQALSSTFNTSGDTLARSEAESILGEIALRSGRPEACDMLRRSSVGLRSQLYGARHDHATVALVRSLIALGTSYSFSGRFREQWDAVKEARNRLNEMGRPNRPLQLTTRVDAAVASHFIGGNSDDSERELRACYDISISSGFILSALDIAVYLATFYRLRGAADLAIELMASLSNVGKATDPTRTKAFFYCSFATLLSSRGRHGLAAKALTHAQDSTLPGQPDLEAQLHLVNTRSKLAEGAHLEALDASAKAEVVFAELGRPGLIGVCLHLRSLAFIKLGRRQEALQAAHDAVDALSAGHPDARRSAQETLSSLKAPQTRGTGHAVR
jgi:hypothetical protein